jgi:hypothetical protein
MTTGMSTLPYPEVRVRRTRPPRWRGSWPPEISGRGLTTPRSTDRLSYYYASGDSINARCVAVEWAESLVYVWSCAKRVA